MGQYALEAHENAKETASEFIDDMVDELLANGEVDRYFGQEHSGADEMMHGFIDREYRLLEAAQMLDDLSEFEETDEGLWQGLMPRQAISSQAAWTMRNAIHYYFQNIIDAINADATSGTLGDMLAVLAGEEVEMEEGEEAPYSPVPLDKISLTDDVDRMVASDALRDVGRHAEADALLASGPVQVSRGTVVSRDTVKARVAEIIAST